MGEWSRDVPWRQGHLLTPDTVEKLGLVHPHGRLQTLAIVATHSCDLAQSPDKEPNVEIIIGRIINELDGNSTHAKTARRLHIEFEGNGSYIAEFEATSKVSIKKEALADFTPLNDSRLSSENFSTFQFWLARRYRRSAFPDEFEDRLKYKTKLAEKISRTLKPLGNLISGIFFDVDDGDDIKRHDHADTYKLDIFILYSVDFDANKAEAAANSAAKIISEAFDVKLFKPTKTWEYIELRSCEAVAESVITYQQYRQLKRWELDYISLADNPQNPVLAD